MCYPLLHQDIPLHTHTHTHTHTPDLIYFFYCCGCEVTTTSVVCNSAAFLIYLSYYGDLPLDLTNLKLELERMLSLLNLPNIVEKNWKECMICYA